MELEFDEKEKELLKEKLKPYTPAPVIMPWLDVFILQDRLRREIQMATIEAYERSNREFQKAIERKKKNPFYRLKLWFRKIFCK